MSSPWLTPKNLMIFFFVLLLVAAGAAGTYLADQLYYKPMRERQQMLENLKALVARLTRQERVAEVVVLEQAGEPLQTKFSWIEVDTQGRKLGRPREFTIEGKVAYFDSLVIHFKTEFNPFDELPLKRQDVAEQLAQKSLIVFRRVFGEQQKPADGFPLDEPLVAPGAYRTPEPPSAFEKKLWREFWKLANDPDLARERGVDAACGQAVYTELEKGRTYVLERRLLGNLIIKPKP